VHDKIGDGFDCHEANEGSSELNEEVNTFLKLIEDARQPLYPLCEEFSKLSIVIVMYHLKCLYEVTDRAFDAFVKLFKRALPKDSTLPNSFEKIQNIIKQFGLGYQKIDACPNDCILFWKDKAELNMCPECDALRCNMIDDGAIMKLASSDPV